jgi:predicted DNA-binding transcriptional regulator YafY
MINNDTKRLTRLTSILTQLQSKKLLTAQYLADRFDVSTRTIYRDMKALEEAGVPIYTEEGKGYALMDDYRIPPVMFTENEANALITAEQLILKNKDASFIKEYSEAITKIKAVLKHSVKDKAELLANRIEIRQNTENEKTSDYLSILQFTLTNFVLVEIKYIDENDNISTRIIEPFAVFSTKENWLLIAKCRLRNDFRMFRLDRIQSLKVLNEKFESHNMTLQEFFDAERRRFLQTLDTLLS